MTTLAEYYAAAALPKPRKKKTPAWKRKANKRRDVYHAVQERDHFTCRQCGQYTEAVPHHVVPRSQGGSDDPDNLILLCEECHRTLHEAPWKS